MGAQRKAENQAGPVPSGELPRSIKTSRVLFLPSFEIRWRHPRPVAMTTLLRPLLTGLWFGQGPGPGLQFVFSLPSVLDLPSPDVFLLTASFLTKKLNIGGKRDTAGQERFHALGPIYYRDSNGAILVYDITDEDSFQKVKNWVKELRKMLGNEISLCIVGNKTDLEKERTVSVQEAEGYAESVGAKHYHTSAKLNKGIEELFLDLCKRMMETAQADERAKGNGASQSGASRRGVQIIDDEPQAATAAGGGCCSVLNSALDTPLITSTYVARE
ncbi:ras-related protein Rab-21-like [Scleropages formosus]|uniref:Ras-related protein Rab-21 n=1 Tax=Scleropages formosus TaxID=113540 RepID=A0A0P7UUH9_SCLFO|nr:ras-related protein Rab-21-like [Scleropages formosus]